MRYSIDSTREDILIFGSSRAESHFIPDIITDSTKLSSYNCGFGGADLLFSRIQLVESLKRYKPKCVLVEVSPSAFFIPDAIAARKILLPFYSRDSLVYQALTNNKLSEKIKFFSAIYPYNSNIASLLKGVIKGNVDTLKGYGPAVGHIDTVNLEAKVNTTYSSKEIPSEGILYLNDFMTMCNNYNLKVIVICTPVYMANANHDSMVEHIKRISLEYNNTYFLDYSRSSFTYKQKQFFKDNTHLNNHGAQIFSERLSSELKKIL